LYDFASFYQLVSGHQRGLRHFVRWNEETYDEAFDVL